MLQNDLRKLYKCADRNTMKFNANKFELLQCGTDQEIKSATTYKSYDDSNINDKEQVRDLGIMMSNTATFILYIRNIVIKPWVDRRPMHCLCCNSRYNCVLGHCAATQCLAGDALPVIRRWRVTSDALVARFQWPAGDFKWPAGDALPVMRWWRQVTRQWLTQ